MWPLRRWRVYEVWLPLPSTVERQARAAAMLDRWGIVMAQFVEAIEEVGHAVARVAASFAEVSAVEQEQQHRPSLWQRWCRFIARLERRNHPYAMRYTDSVLDDSHWGPISGRVCALAEWLTRGTAHD